MVRSQGSFCKELSVDFRCTSEVVELIKVKPIRLASIHVD
jgi:hypothetical protein